MAQRAGFDLIEPGLDEELARQEAARCLQCSEICEKCVEVCPNRANRVYLTPSVALKLSRLALQAGQLVQIDVEDFTVQQKRQIIHIDDFCNECGNCATFCVHEGRPYQDKPRLFLNAIDFRKEEENAFYIESSAIYHREKGQESCLTIRAEDVLFENDALSLTLSPLDFHPLNWEIKRSFEGEQSLVEAAEMWLILKGVGPGVDF